MKCKFFNAIFLLPTILCLSLNLTADELIKNFENLKIKFISELGEDSDWKFNEEKRYFENDKNEILIISKFDYDLKKSEKFINNQIIQTQLQYAPKDSLFKGMVTPEKTCKNAPKVEKKIFYSKSGIHYFSELPATAELQFGSCGMLKEPLISQRLIIYCSHDDVLYDIYYFRPNQDKTKPFKKPVAYCQKRHQK